ncbi:MAG: hypothetical protein ACTHOO_05230 [Alcanivorax sp.]
MRRFFLICLLASFIPMHAQARAPKSTLMMSDEELHVRKWALRAVSELMTFKHDGFLENLESNRHYLTKDSCKQFVWIMEAFQIRTNAEEEQEDITTGRSERVPYKIALGFIKLKHVSEKHIEKYGLPDHARLWEVEIPLVVGFKKGIIERKYNYATEVKVLKIGHGKNDYVIYKMNPEGNRNSLRMDDTKYTPSRYDECKEINFVELNLEGQ